MIPRSFLIKHEKLYAYRLYESTRPTGCPFVFLSWPVDTWRKQSSSAVTTAPVYRKQHAQHQTLHSSMVKATHLNQPFTKSAPTCCRNRDDDANGATVLGWRRQYDEPANSGLTHARCSDDEKNRWRFPPPWMENNVSQLPRQLVPNQVWNTLKAQFEKLFRQQDTVTRTSCNFVADLLTIQPTCAHSDAPNKGEEDKLQQKIQKNKNVFFPSTTTAATPLSCRQFPLY